ncbi:glycosyltransferase family 2 protein [Clostridium gasigenes]|nr:glycosyltransferase family 2 protein [Clostridium gasigenes]
MGKLGIILVNYNGKEYNEKCIQSILKSTYKNFIIIVVDNDSKDGSYEELENKFENEVILIKSQDNLGFSVANNIGIKKGIELGCSYFMLLNNDTVISETLIEEMFKVAKNKVIVSPKIYYCDEPKKIWSAGSGVNWKKGLPYQLGIDQMDDGNYDNLQLVPCATGCCLLFNKQLIKDIGYLSDEYFLYYEDTDYTVKAVKYGYDIIYQPKAVLWHKVSASIGGEESENYIYYNTRNRLLFNDRFNNENKTYYMTYFYLTRLLKCIKWILKGRKYLVKATIEGIKDYKDGVVGKR